MTNSEDKNSNKVVIKEIKAFLIEETDRQTVARSFQRLITILALTVIRNDGGKNPYNIDHIDDGIYYLSRFVELLQPEKPLL